MPHILIVEDEAAIADTLVYALQAEGFATRWLGLAGAALELLAREPFDLVILDVGLPDISGFEACKRLLLGLDDLENVGPVAFAREIQLFVEGRDLQFREGAGSARVRIKTLNGDISLCSK